MEREPFAMPVNVMIDAGSGYAINMPLGPQDYPGWQNDKPEVVERILELRQTWQVLVPDDQFADPPSKRHKTQTGKTGRTARPKPKKRSR